MHGVAFQTDMKVTAAYDGSYFEKCRGYAGNAIARAVTEGRIDLIARHAGSQERVCDVGIGSGEFVIARGHTFGVDINPVAKNWLMSRGLWAYDLTAFRAFSCWDVLEHCVEPNDYLDMVPVGGWLFASVPVFADIWKVRESKHYRPGEHLYYWTSEGFERWLRGYGFQLLERATFESDAGRDGIHSFAFMRTDRE